MQRFFFLGVAKMQVTAADGAVGVRLGGLAGRFGQVQQLENFVARGHTVHRHVEVGPQRTHRQKEICREQQNAKRPGQADTPCGQLPRRDADAECRAAVSDDVHHDDRVELHGQHLHRDLAEVLCLAIHRLMAGLVGPVNFQRGQPLQVFQKAVAQCSVLAPVSAQQPLGKLLHSHNGNRDHRHADHQNDSRFQADGGQHEKQRDGRKHRIEKLRQVRAEISLELLDPLARQLQDLGSGRRLGVAAAQAQ